MGKTYKIVRFFQNDKYAPEVRKTGLTLEEAQKHCKDPETSSRTAKKGPAASMTRNRGAWFDGYEEE